MILVGINRINFIPGGAVYIVVFMFQLFEADPDLLNFAYPASVSADPNNAGFIKIKGIDIIT